MFMNNTTRYNQTKRHDGNWKYPHHKGQHITLWDVDPETTT